MEREMLTIINNDDINLSQFFNSLPFCTKKHSHCVAKITSEIAVLTDVTVYDEMSDIDKFSKEQIYRAVLYHDIGMSLIPDEILKRNGNLTVSESNIIKKHAKFGGKIIRRYIQSNYCDKFETELWNIAAETAVSHHERWDGKGYPFGLRTTAIPILSRITAIADYYDSTVRGEPKRIALPHEYALLNIIDNSGKKFDIRIVNIFKSNYDYIKKIWLYENSKTYDIFD